MKLNRLIIKNIGMVADETIQFNKALILFYGQIKQGKTTILNAVKWALGAPFPADIIRHGEEEASATLEFEGGSVSRSWYRAKSGKVTPRPVELVIKGRPQDRPMDQLRQFLNPFLLDQDHLKNMGAAERNRFFGDVFNVDTEKEDTELLKNEKEAKELRIAIKAVGEITVDPVTLVDTTAIKDEKWKIEDEFSKKKTEWEAEIITKSSEHMRVVEKVNTDNSRINGTNAKIDADIAEVARVKRQIGELSESLEKLKQKSSDLMEGVRDKEPLERLPDPLDHTELLKKISSAPDTSDLQTKLNDAAAIAVKFEQYERDMKRVKARESDENRVEKLEVRRKELVREKTALLQKISSSTGIAGLEFNANGEFRYENTEAGMLSTSQVMGLSMALSGLYPDGLGLELLDRGESLGTSIFKVIERAKKEKKTILAAIVGDKPAETDPEIGVWVVEGGNILGNPKPASTLIITPQEPLPVEYKAVVVGGGAPVAPEIKDENPPQTDKPFTSGSGERTLL